MRESKAKKHERAAEIAQLLYKAYPDSKCSLHYKSAHELLVATILSAQCTDHRVNIVTEDLFLKTALIAGPAGTNPPLEP